MHSEITITEVRLLTTIGALMVTGDQNDMALAETLTLALTRWKDRKAQKLLDKIRCFSNWQHARLTQLEPSLN